MTKKEWKKGFLSSSFPLEFDVAKLLVKKGFMFEPDYCYERIEAGQTKDFSVDLYGNLLFPTSNPNEITASLELLIECKYRTPNKTWVFLPDVNIPDLPLGRGLIIKAIDDFSFCRVFDGPLYRFTENLPLCYKGTELDLSTSNVYDSEIRHGISQLQYALPRLITENIMRQALAHPEDVFPFFVLPILVTTAELRVLQRGTTLAKVEETNILEDITEKVPYLTIFNSFGEDFAEHAKREFKELANIGNYKNVAEIEKRLRKSEIYIKNISMSDIKKLLGMVHEFDLPRAVGKALAKGEHDILSVFCTQFLVCSFDALAEMLNQVKQVIRASLRKRKSF